MGEAKVYRAIGLMSGTSLDGEIDVALIETDGAGYVRPIRSMAYPYDDTIRQKVRICFGKTERDAEVDLAEEAITNLHIEAVKAFGEDADYIGFHGQTLTHKPDTGFTWQIGDAQRLAHEVGIDVVADLRCADVDAGGQGAPLIPLYHAAMMADQSKPVAVLNLGGVSNITYVGDDGAMIAFDCGPANALMDDFMLLRTGHEYDHQGRVASRGVVQENSIDPFLSDPYFTQAPPKSLDRNHWSLETVQYASTEDGMATLLEMSVSAIVRALGHVPQKPQSIYVTGGGRKNLYFVETLSQRLGLSVCNVDDIGWNGDTVEAEGFAYLAVRSILGLPITYPSTTGVKQPMTGGVLYSASKVGVV